MPNCTERCAGEALVEEARELARLVNFAPSNVSASIDLLLNLARRHDCGRAEQVVAEAVQAAEATGGWHLWLWRIRLAEAQAELALARGEWNEAIQSAEDAIHPESHQTPRQIRIARPLDPGARLRAPGSPARSDRPSKFGLGNGSTTRRPGHGPAFGRRTFGH